MFPPPPRLGCGLDVNDLDAQHSFDVIGDFPSPPHSTTFEVDGDECVSNVSLTSLLSLNAAALTSRCDILREQLKLNLGVDHCKR